MEKEYYENGNLWYETPYENGVQHGVTKIYYKNGNLKYKTPFESNMRHGVEERYYENGNLQAQITYENGNIVSGVCGDGKKIPNIQGLGYWGDIQNQISTTCKK